MAQTQIHTLPDELILEIMTQLLDVALTCGTADYRNTVQRLLVVSKACFAHITHHVNMTKAEATHYENRLELQGCFGMEPPTYHPIDPIVSLGHDSVALDKFLAVRKTKACASSLVRHIERLNPILWQTD